MGNSYKRKTTKHTQPYIDAEGNISEASLRKGAFKRILRAFSEHVTESVRTLQPHMTFEEFYLKNVKFEFPTSRVILLYINNKKS